jgi:cysteine desulfurase/selenocysteine lyase
LGAAIEFLQKLNIDDIANHERELLSHAFKLIENKEYINIIGYNGTNVSALSFMMNGVHPHDIASLLDRNGIAVRAGHHCAHPLMQFYGVNSTTRISFALYTTKEEVEQLRREVNEKTKKLEKRTQALEKAAKKLVELEDPPVTEEKVKKMLESWN